MIAQIISIIPLWKRLDGDDKYNFERLIDHKIGVLSRSFRSAGNSPYELLDRVLDLKATLGSAGFDLGSVETLISQEVGSILELNGLEYLYEDVNDDPLSVQGEDVDEDADEVIYCSNSFNFK